jgi:hypothetical protein
MKDIIDDISFIFPISSGLLVIAVIIGVVKLIGQYAMYIFAAFLFAIPIAVLVGAFIIMRKFHSFGGKMMVLILAVIIDVFLVRAFFKGPKPLKKKGEEKTEQVEETAKETKSKKTTFVLLEQPGMLEELGLTIQDTLTA